MVQDSISNIINNALVANRNNKYNNEKKLISNFSETVRENIKLFEMTNDIDVRNNNGFRLDAAMIDKILKKYEKVDSLINLNEKISLLMNNELLRSDLYSSLGVVLVMFDGNTYTMLEMILLGLLTHNTIIFTSNGYMGGTNGLLIELIQTIIKKENMNKYMFQQSLSMCSNEFFNNFKSINKTIIIGDNEFIDKYVRKATTEVLVSGYKHYNIYIDSLNNIEFIKKILAQNFSINTYVNNNLNVQIENAIFVDDLDEAITNINYNGSKYSSSIFTENKENAARFLSDVSSKYVMINTSPTLVQELDIKQEDLLRKKTVVTPNYNKYSNSSKKTDDEKIII